MSVECEVKPRAVERLGAQTESVALQREAAWLRRAMDRDGLAASPFLMACERETRGHREVVEDLHAQGVRVALAATPRVVVSGARNSGKSSVVECLLGVPLSGVTSCEIQLRHARTQKAGAFRALIVVSSAGGALQDRATSWTSMVENISVLCSALEAANSARAQHKHLQLRVESSLVPNLDIVETRCVDGGDGGAGARSAALGPETTILAVMDATAPRATQLRASAAALQHAASRTIGVITKTDLVRADGRAMQVTEWAASVHRPLKLGYVALALRERLAFQDSRRHSAWLSQEERAFFSDGVLKLGSDAQGVSALAERLALVVAEQLDAQLIEALSEPSFLKRCCNSIAPASLGRLMALARASKHALAHGMFKSIDAALHRRRSKAERRHGLKIADSFRRIFFAHASA